MARNPEGMAVPGEVSDPCGIGGIGNTINFAIDSSELSDDAQNVLRGQACWLNRVFPSLNVTVEGHADERGTREYNLALGERRANSAAKYLVALGVDKSRIWIISYGKERSICSEASQVCWAQNRRAVTVINK